MQPSLRTCRKLGKCSAIHLRRFRCIACGLRIEGIAKLSALDLGDLYTHTRTSTIADYFDLYTEEELEEARNAPPPPDWGYDDDFNEY